MIRVHDGNLAPVYKSSRYELEHILLKIPIKDRRCWWYRHARLRVLPPYVFGTDPSPGSFGPSTGVSTSSTNNAISSPMLLPSFNRRCRKYIKKPASGTPGTLVHASLFWSRVFFSLAFSLRLPMILITLGRSFCP